MAYSYGNPDALPAHAQPEEAAAILNSQSHVQSRPHNRPHPHPLPPHQPIRQNSHGFSSRPDSIHSGNGWPGMPPAHQHPYRHDSPAPGLAPPLQNSYRLDSQASGRPPNLQNHAGKYRQGSPALPPKEGIDRNYLWKIFGAVDRDRSGQITERELKPALVNGDWSSFDPCTVRMMIRMFDSDRSGTINFDEFCGLWGFLASWRTLFNRFDLDGSGNISFTEFNNALAEFGYRLSIPFVNQMFHIYDRRHEGCLSFDLFVQACINLKRMTDEFKKFDIQRKGFVTLSFEDYLGSVQSLSL